jgi:lipopolysaccharide/colanic/teichoic acid biosynthesis glycosyltransferase
MLDEMPKWAKARLSERPGLTGLAQVNGNIELSWEQRWKYDVQYVGEISLLNDLKIILRTVLVVIFGESTFRRLP